MSYLLSLLAPFSCFLSPILHITLPPGNPKFLRHFVRTVFPDSEPSSDDTLPSMLATGSNLIEVDISQITTLYTIAQLDTCANELSPLGGCYVCAFLASPSFALGSAFRLASDAHDVVLMSL
ncbi:hypothetical protein BC936DRAFT_144081 [Jimgerdemannia flammicorona]|uniref:Uncharacterized protein n=1 Tax=Jimgerdemannia flammicorona TaxID=994334 RepID=A0A433DD14_9FUNG|nr:hypothetical protein BC936DRAFT_144081 [Jimgerdemannia flammicorona]